MGEESKTMLNHQILIIDAKLIDFLNEEQMNKITENLMTDLLSTLEMKPLGPLGIYPALDLNYPGWSFLQPITTSHISGHYFSKSEPDIHIDIYSCKDFSFKKAIEVINDNLKLSNWLGTYIRREIDQKRKIIELTGIGSSIST
jgi:hypothetical protein